MRNTIISCDICGRIAEKGEDMLHMETYFGSGPYVHFDICEGCISRDSTILSYALGQSIGARDDGGRLCRCIAASAEGRPTAGVRYVRRMTDGPSTGRNAATDGHAGTAWTA